MARAGASGFPQVVVRNYQGSSIEAATQDYQRDAASMGQHGYAPISQSWQPPSTGNGVALVGILLIVAGWFFGLLLPPERDSEFGFSDEFKAGLIVAGTVIGLLVVVLSLLFFRKPGTLTVTYQWAAGPGYPTAPPALRTARHIRPPLRLVFVVVVVLLTLGASAWAWVRMSEVPVYGCAELSDGSADTSETSGAASAQDFRLDMQLTCGELRVSRGQGSDWRVAAIHAKDAPPEIDATTDTLSINGGARDDPGVPRRWLRSDLDVELPPQAALSVEVTLNEVDGSLDLGVGPLASVLGTFNASDVIVVDLVRATTPEPARIDLTFNASDGELLLPSASVVGTVALNASSLTLCIPDDAEARLGLEATLASDDLADSGLVKSGESWQTLGYGAGSNAIDLQLTSTVSSLSVERSPTCR